MLAALREHLVRELDQLPHIVSLYASKDAGFVDQSIEWLHGLEECLGRFRNPSSAHIAALRAKILATGDGYRHPSLMQIKSPRKAIRAAAGTAIEEAEITVRTEIRSIDDQFNSLREKMVQLVAVASVNKPIPLPPSEPRESWLRKVWHGLAGNGQTEGMYAYLNAALNLSDRLYLLDRIMENFVSNAGVENQPVTNQ